MAKVGFTVDEILASVTGFQESFRTGLSAQQNLVLGIVGALTEYEKVRAAENRTEQECVPPS